MTSLASDDAPLPHLPAPNLDRLMADLVTLATFVEPGTPGTTRRFPSQAHVTGRRWLRQRMDEAGLRTTIDTAGNLLGVRPGQADLSPIMIGSHSDTVFGGGRYDGALGVLGALEVARTLAEANVALRHPLIVADYLAEEATDFGVSCIGSRAMTASFDPAWLERTLDGQTLAQAIAAVGGKPDAIGEAERRPGDVAACLELHIEQGPVLEAQGIGLGAVSGIVGILRAIFELRGRPDHAGTTPMSLRRDALAAGAEVVAAVERIARGQPGAVGTVGRIEIGPNQSNVVPGVVRLTAEMRHLDETVLDEIWGQFVAETQAICARRDIGLDISAVTRMHPAAPPPWLLELVLAACRELDANAITLPSGAGHDSAHLAHIAPSAMIFVPSVGGRSHCPEEETYPEDLARGVAALMRAVVAVDRR
ncbi:MAG: Zn-dependent hydrolase [Anaerolineae bacterium]